MKFGGNNEHNKIKGSFIVVHMGASGSFYIGWT